MSGGKKRGAFLERDKKCLELWKRHPPAMPMCILWAAAAFPNSAVLPPAFCGVVIKQGSHIMTSFPT